MGDWPKTTLGDLGPITTGKTPRSGEKSFFGGEIPFVTPSDMFGQRYVERTERHLTDEGLRSISSRTLPAGAIMVSCIGSDMGKTSLARSDCYTNQQINTIEVVRDDIHPLFVYYNLFARKDELQRLAAGSSAQPILNKSNFSRVAIPLPPLPYQIAVADLLGSLDDKIELNRRMNETLEAMAQAIFRDWFVDFGPTRRKIAGATDPVEIMGGLVTDPDRARQLADLFPALLDDNSLPAGWEFRPLSETLILQRGFDLPKTQRTDGAFPVITASGPSGTHNSFKVKGPGVCTGRSGVLGKIYFVEEDFWPLNTTLWVKEFRKSAPSYAYFLLATLGLEALNAGSAVPTLNRNHVHNRNVVTAPMNIMTEFERLASLLIAGGRALLRQNDVLVDLRDLLLPRLMSGEIRLRDAKAVSEAAA